MIDIHSHILPGIDDGAASLQVSRDMLAASAAAGFTTIIATPHLVSRLQPDYSRSIQSALEQLRTYAHEAGITLLQGFEIRLNPDLPRQLLRGDPIALDSTNAILLDLPFTAWPTFTDDILFQVQTAGSRIVLAHPERYSAIQENPNLAVHLVERGIILQVTIGSLSGIHGRTARRTAEELLRLGTVQLAATDAHSAGDRMAAVPAGIDRIRELLGEEQLQDLFVVGPGALLSGAPLPAPVRPITRSWTSRLPFRRR
jgi:protein-tyrosine phosphatase